MDERDELLERLAREAETRRYGKYEGFVVKNDDPKKRGRLQVKIPSVLGEATSDWALPCVPFGGAKGHGLFFLPEVDDQVWVEFVEGDIDRPIWTGTWWPKGAGVPKFSQRTLETPSGQKLCFDDKKKTITLEHSSGTKIDIDDQGSITAKDAGGGKFKLDAQAGELELEDKNGNKLKFDSQGISIEDANGGKLKFDSQGITLDASKVVLKASEVELGGSGGEELIKKSFLDLYASHTHPTSAPGAPTAPPTADASSTASTSVKTK